MSMNYLGAIDCSSYVWSGIDSEVSRSVRQSAREEASGMPVLSNIWWAQLTGRLMDFSGYWYASELAGRTPLLEAQEGMPSPKPKP